MNTPSELSSSALNRRKALKLAALGGVGLAAANAGLGLAAAEQAQAAESDMQDAVRNIRLTEIRFIKLEFPGEIPVQWNAIKKSGGGQPKDTIMEIHTDAGIVGHARPKGPQSLIMGEALSRLKGQNLMEIERMWDRMYRHDRKSIAKGEYIKAMGSIDVALWDIIGKALNLPVHRILGTYRTTIPVYAAGGYYMEDKSIRDLVKEMEGYVDEGFRHVKMKVAGAPLREDVERVKAVREALGPDIGLMLDANNGFNQFQAIRFGRAVQKYDPYWFEEPVMPDDFQGCAEVRRTLDMPIVAGENEFTRWGTRDLITHQCADILNLDVIKAGGITEYRKIAAAASAFHIPVAPHGTVHMSMHTMASTDNGLIMEVYPGARRYFNPTLPQLEVKDGMMTIPEKPGLGLEFDQDMINKYRVS